MLIGIELITAGILVVALALMSIIDFAFAGVNKISLRRLMDTKKSKPIPLLLEMVDRRVEGLIAIHIGIQLVLIVIAILLAGAFIRSPFPYPVSLVIAIVLMLAVILVFRQLIPRMFVSRNPEFFLLHLFPLFKVFYYALRPFSRLLIFIVNYFHRLEEEMEPKEEEASEEEIQAFIDVGQEEGILEQDEGEMVHSIVEFGDKVVREVMTPRTRIVAIDISSPIEELLSLMVTKKHSRIPVFRDHLDNVEGIVSERDLLQIWRSGEKVDNLRPLVKPVHFIPETKPVDDLLQEMKREAHQIALVVDEYGGVAGLVTMEDLIEEIVGEIRDESESERERIVEESDGIYLVPGGLELSALEEKLGMPFLEGTDCTTIGGAVVELFGRVPAAGEKTEHQNISVEVLEADRRRVHRLRMRLLTPKQ